MSKKYIAILKSDKYNSDFINYLERSNVVYKFLDGINLYIIQTHEQNYKKIRNLPYIELIVENFKVKANFDDITLPNLQNGYQDLDYKNWGIKKIKAPCMWNRGFTGKGIKVALLDTGVNPHKDIKLAGSVSFIPNQGPEDDNGHGTKMAGIIAARNFKDGVVGIAWECDLYNVKAFTNNPDDDEGIASVLKSLEWCFNNDMDVISLSLTIEPLDGGTFPQKEKALLRGAFMALKSKGIIVCCSTGNNGKNNLNYPGALSSDVSNVLSVGAVDINDERIQESNYGPNIFCVAPGADIVTTSKNGGYTLTYGTSPATSFVSGFVALLLNQYKPATIEEIKQVIIDNAQGFGTDVDLGTQGYDLEYGYGRISAPYQYYTILLQSNKNIYTCGDEVKVNIQLLDKDGFEIDSNINLKATLITPNKEVIKREVETDENGKKIVKIESSCDNEVGEYIVNVVGDEGGCTIKNVASTKFTLLKNSNGDKVLSDENYYIKNSTHSNQLNENEIINILIPILNTNKGYYNINEKGCIEIEVKDEKGKIVKQVSLDINIKFPSGYVKNVNGITGNNGKLSIPFVTSNNNCLCNYCKCLYFTLQGEYSVDLRASKTNYEGNETNIKFYIEKVDSGCNKYCVSLTDSLHKSIFEAYLTSHNIKYSLNDEILVYTICTNKNNINYIKSLDYVKNVCEDCIISTINEDIHENKIVENRNINILNNTINQYRNWGISKIKAPCMWDKGIIGSGIKVAILDTGVYQHRDISVKEYESFIPGVTPVDEDGHGTQVAGIICAKNFLDRVVGVAWDCELYSLKVANKEGVYLAALIPALEWCIKNKMDVVNMSLVFNDLNDEQKQILTDVIIKLGQNNIIAVSSTGNEGKSTISYPAVVKPAIAVGSTDIDDNISTFSNYGVGINYVAPGENIYTTSLYNNYKEVKGTSFATPFVTGMIALMLSEDSILSQEEIELLLNKNAKDLGVNRYDLRYGYGRINAPLNSINIVITPSKKIFSCNQSGNIVFNVFSDKGENTSNILIHIKIYTPDEKIISHELKTQCGGVAILDITTNCDDIESSTNFNKIGVYKIEARFEEDKCYPEIVYKSEFSIFS